MNPGPGVSHRFTIHIPDDNVNNTNASTNNMAEENTRHLLDVENVRRSPMHDEPTTMVNKGAQFPMAYAVDGGKPLEEPSK
jgi:hypothetical protein